MKHIKYIFASLLLLLPVLAHADGDNPPVYDNYKTGNGLALGKSVSSASSNNIYTLTLETFATGAKAVVNIAKPADIVLVLDLSQSMTDVYGDNYVARNGEYSYNSLRSGNADKAYYFYRHTDGNYYQVHTAGGNNSRRLTYQVGNTTWYLWGNGSQNTNPQGNRSNTATIFTGDLYECTRLTALQGAVENFVSVIYHNDNFDDDDNPRENPLTNRISIVTFGGPQENTNVTRQMSPLTNVTNSDGSLNTSMISGLLALTGDGINNSDHYGTYADEGMVLANNVLNGINSDRKEKGSRTVVLFTDGAPGSGPGWTTGTGNTNSQPTANRAIQAAATAKTTHTASVFTIILGDIVNTDMGDYLQYTSSNYPDATQWNNPGTQKYETYALEAGDDLEGVFETVASSSGGSEETIPAESMLVDAVSSSFEVPSSFTASQVVVYTRDVKTDGTAFDDETKHPLEKIILPSNYDLTSPPPTDAEYMTDEDKVGVYLYNGQLMIVGFNYSKDDGEGEDGTTGNEYSGNWVGWREGTDGSKICAGRELVIEFDIEAIDGVTGGDHTNTNTASSGVLIPTYDSEGHFTGYQRASTYPYPDTDLPIRLVIEKTGLRHGESATIQIYRAPQKAGSYDSITGKPAPDLTNGWENFSKVILTNKGDDLEKVTKTLLSLDPKYVYRLVEDDWGWSYNLDTKEYNTSSKEKNPFTFENSLRTDAVKHAEAVSINHFGEMHKAENYKSSKTNNFSNNSNSNNSD